MIKKLVDNNVNEGEIHDFKADIPKDAKKLTDLCCSFANSPKGGFIVLGVNEIGSRFNIEGIVNDKELLRRFSEKVRAIPTISTSSKIIPIPKSPKILAVFHIPFSLEGPHVPVDKQRRPFWKRTNKGKEYMTYEEIKMAFQHVPHEERKQHSLYLNGILKKLSVVRHVTKYDKKLYLEVPTNYEDYRLNTYFLATKPKGLTPVTWIDIKYLDHLKWVLSHLEHNEYRNIRISWYGLTKMIIDYNQLVDSAISILFRKVSTHIIQAIKGSSDKNNEFVGPRQSKKYYSRNIFEFLFRSYKDYILDKDRVDFNNIKIFQDESNSFQVAFYEHHYLAEGTIGLDKKVFVESSSQERLDTNKFRGILNSICDEPDLIKPFSNLQDKIIKIDRVRFQFRNQLRPLIKDIDGGYLMKGSCLLGY